MLEGVSAWAGIRVSEPGRDVGWSLLLDGEVEHVEIGADDPGECDLATPGPSAHPWSVGAEGICVRTKVGSVRSTEKTGWTWTSSSP